MDLPFDKGYDHDKDLQNINQQALKPNGIVKSNRPYINTGKVRGEKNPTIEIFPAPSPILKMSKPGTTKPGTRASGLSSGLNGFFPAVNQPNLAQHKLHSRLTSSTTNPFAMTQPQRAYPL
jgi:hypothetical protein